MIEPCDGDRCVGRHPVATPGARTVGRSHPATAEAFGTLTQSFQTGVPSCRRCQEQGRLAANSMVPLTPEPFVPWMLGHALSQYRMDKTTIGSL